jgi:hypothetical protein
MSEIPDLLASIQTRRHLEEINEYILHNLGEIVEVPGKISLVWTDPIYDQRRFLGVKAAGDEQIIINGRRYPATEEGLQQGLVSCLKEQGE